METPKVKIYPRLMQVAKDLNMGTTAVTDLFLLNNIDCDDLKPTSRINEAMSEVLRYKFNYEYPAPAITNIKSSILPGPRIIGKVELPVKSKSGEDTRHSRFTSNSFPNSTRNNHRASSYPTGLKLGKVKFFDNTKGFGYIYSYTDKKDCFIHSSKIITSGIQDDDIVIFETVDSRKKPGELDAIRVSNNIRVFIFNIESSPKSFAYAFLDTELQREIELTEKYETGFYTIAANERLSRWKISIIETEKIGKQKSLDFGKKVLSTLLLNLTKYKNAIIWLTEFIKSVSRDSDLESIYSNLIDQLEQKGIAEIDKEIKCIVEHDFLSSFLEEKKSTLNKISFVLWAQTELDKLPKISNPAEENVWCFDILPHLTWQLLQQVFLRLKGEQGESIQVIAIVDSLIEKGWQINSEEELNTFLSFFESAKSNFSSIELTERNFTCKINEYYILLYKKGIIKELSENKLIEHIQGFKSDEEKSSFIEQLPAESILPIYTFFPSLSQYQEKYITGLLENEFSKIDFLCFDLESDGEKINEYAWETNSETKSHSDFDQLNDGIGELVNLLNTGTLIIGQNIKKFDLPILEEKGAKVLPDTIWDTFEIEMVLNPHRFSYGLKTEHSAVSDTQTTLRLFKNQLARIIFSKEDLNEIIDLLPLSAIDFIKSVRNNPNLKSLDSKSFEIDSKEFFRPNPVHRAIPEKSLIEIKEKLNEEGIKIIVAPEILWETLSYQFEIAFYSEKKNFGLSLNKEKIEIILANDKFLQRILTRFVDGCNSKKLKPFLEHLPTVIKLLLDPQQLALICDNVVANLSSTGHVPICILPGDIHLLNQPSVESSEINLILLGKELFNITNKLQLGPDLDFATLFDRLKNEPIWLQLSGGKSFVSIEQSQCNQLGITDYPEFVQNIWLEKIGKGKFKVWCNVSIEDCIGHLVVKEVVNIEWVTETSFKENAFIVRPDKRKSGYVAEQRRVNPESLSRTIYWVYQFKLFEGLADTNNPKVLILNDDLEDENIMTYARRKGYFVPDKNASLARQVEILHTYKSRRKILITNFKNLDKVISANYFGPLDFIWDSFLLTEKLQMFKGKMPDSISDSNEIENDDFEEKRISTQINNDSFSLIKLHKPLIDYYYQLLYDNNQHSNLFICDARLTDFYGIEKTMNLKARFIEMWYKEIEYDNDREVATQVFPRLNINQDVDFNIDEAKEILRQIFLMPKEGGVPYEWYDYQHSCLNDILPAQKDLLVSLPTGAGKSLLFQGPALFRSAFSSKLSIIISPLRALMQDQVIGLQDKGFYSNVEYLSGDKSQIEIRDIYRRLSGGEITFLYITPERFRSRSFVNCLLTRLDADQGLEYVIFDEAHCISQWGQEFRPDYLNAARVIEDYSKAYNLRKLLFSATISEQVFDEISFLMPGIVTVEGAEKTYNPVRDHIKMDFKHNVIEDDRLLEVANYLKAGNFNPELSRAIVFVKSRKKVEESSILMPDSLRDVFGDKCNFAEKVGSFHAGMDSDDRNATYEKYQSGEIVILFATKAFGMGMDIPNIHFVAHYSPPGTFEDFLQEIGRAGRNERQRLEAGFNNKENPIKSLCLTANNDFGKLKDQLHESRISWQEVKDIKLALEIYIQKFKPLIPDLENPLAVPFNLHSIGKDSTNIDLDNKFRIGLHWLEKLERIKLGYFTITHLEFDTLSLVGINERINNCPDKDSERLCEAIATLVGHSDETNEVVQISIASLRELSKLSLEKLYSTLITSHISGILKLVQKVAIEPTKIRQEEIIFYKNQYTDGKKYPAIQVIFSAVFKILSRVPFSEAKIFDGDELDFLFNESIEDNIGFSKLPWSKTDKNDAQKKELVKYIEDVNRKRTKHAFTIIRLLGKTKNESQIDKVLDANKKVLVRQSVYNGYHKKEEWTDKLNQLKKDCIKLLEYVANESYDRNNKSFNWADVISKLEFKKNIKYLSDLLFILSVMGYCKSGGLFPSGIEVYLTSTDTIEETNLSANDPKVYDEFIETQEIRELKLISLQVLSNLELSEQDAFIKGFFAARSKKELINHLEGEIDSDHPIFKAFRGDAIKYQENERLNEEQKLIYFADPNQNINVMAGPGSGKTHTPYLTCCKAYTSLPCKCRRDFGLSL